MNTNNILFFVCFANAKPGVGVGSGVGKGLGKGKKMYGEEFLAKSPKESMPCVGVQNGITSKGFRVLRKPCLWVRNLARQTHSTTTRGRAMA